MDKPEKSAPCPMCNYPGHLSTYDENTKIATYVCDRCHQIFKEFYKRWLTIRSQEVLKSFSKIFKSWKTTWQKSPVLQGLKK